VPPCGSTTTYVYGCGSSILCASTCVPMYATASTSPPLPLQRCH
jgi:hypothetical protein